MHGLNARHRAPHGYAGIDQKWARIAIRKFLGSSIYSTPRPACARHCAIAPDIDCCFPAGIRRGALARPAKQKRHAKFAGLATPAIALPVAVEMMMVCTRLLCRGDREDDFHAVRIDAENETALVRRQTATHLCADRITLLWRPNK